ncbi:ABC transporter ATP-binding protein [Allokutzneria sp. NRRL B-24872]|uniref:ABC transporter ATP-binding protein n=1 Tax=Allokutzneria sp. NRRL B-24872 TaxID=1137961 RepID=UPI000A3C6596|nr:ABC transporter ATP-binding protein [Allokutzneria sp. NRRL B-24872]
MIRNAAAAVGVAWRAAPALLLGHLTAGVLAGMAPVAAAWFTKLVLDRLVLGQTDDLVWPALALATTGALTIVIVQGSQYLSGELERRVAMLTRDRLYTATGRMGGLAMLEQPAFQDRLRMAQLHSDSGPRLILESVVGGVQSLITLLGFLGSLAALSLVLAATALLAAIPALLAEIQLSRRRATVLTALSPTERRQFFYADLMTSLDAAKEIRLLGLNALFRKRMLTEFAHANAERRRMDRRELGVQGLLGVLGAVVAGAGLVWAILAAGRGLLTVGDVAVFLAAVAGTQASITAIAGRLGTAHNALLLFAHYQEVTKAEPDLPCPPDPAPVPKLSNGIELRDVWFRYSEDHPWALRGVNLTIPFGQSMALVGPNGAGKSTLVKLLCRFYDPTRGSVSWDGVDLRDMAVEQLRARIGAVFQDFMSYELSAAENIALGDVDGADELRLGTAMKDRVHDAAQRAGVHDMLSGLPRGYDTMLSRLFQDEDDDTGVLLSGGQWQRVALARAFLRDQRDLLILDEPASGLDADAEAQIHTRLAAHRAGRASVLISHRLGSVRDADQIAVLVDGRIEDLGTHRELLHRDATYARLFRIQANGYAPA